MRYVHYCGPCDARSPARPDRYQALADRDEHRQRAHHGLIPRDHIEEIPGPLAVAGRALVALLAHGARVGARRLATSEAVRQVRASAYWQQAVRLLAIGAGLLILGAVLVRHH